MKAAGQGRAMAGYSWSLDDFLFEMPDPPARSLFRLIDCRADLVGAEDFDEGRDEFRQGNIGGVLIVLFRNPDHRADDEPDRRRRRAYLPRQRRHKRRGESRP